MKKALIASAALAALCPLGAAAAERTLTISVYAFAQDDFKTLVYDPFEAKCGCKLVVETGNSVERLAKMEANKANPVVDLAAVSMADALAASRAGLIDKIDTAKLADFAKLYDVAKDPNGDGMSVGYTFYATSIAYRSDKMKIDSWADLLKPEYIGHVAFPNVTTNQGPPALYMLGLALGKDTSDLKGPIEALGEKKDEIVTSTKSPRSWCS
jgi:putative spermidine/putrescine transport system substrate-binding protein